MLYIILQSESNYFTPQAINIFFVCVLSVMDVGGGIKNLGAVEKNHHVCFRFLPVEKWAWPLSWDTVSCRLREEYHCGHLPLHYYI